MDETICEDIINLKLWWTRSIFIVADKFEDSSYVDLLKKIALAADGELIDMTISKFNPESFGTGEEILNLVTMFQEICPLRIISPKLLNILNEETFNIEYVERVAYYRLTGTGRKYLS
jgi:hypothetical protein